MKDWVITGLILASLILVIGAAGCRDSQVGPQQQPQGQSDPSGAAFDVVTLENFAFSPQEKNVVGRKTVKWVNRDGAPHTIVADDGSFESPRLQNGKEWTYTFQETGRYSYHCGLHPTMKGILNIMPGV